MIDKIKIYIENLIQKYDIFLIRYLFIPIIVILMIWPFYSRLIKTRLVIDQISYPIESNYWVTYFVILLVVYLFILIRIINYYILSKQKQTNFIIDYILKRLNSDMLHEYFSTKFKYKISYLLSLQRIALFIQQYNLIKISLFIKINCIIKLICIFVLFIDIIYYNQLLYIYKIMPILLIPLIFSFLLYVVRFYYKAYLADLISLYKIKLDFEKVEHNKVAITKYNYYILDVWNGQYNTNYTQIEQIDINKAQQLVSNVILDLNNTLYLLQTFTEQKEKYEKYNKYLSILIVFSLFILLSYVLFNHFYNIINL